MKKVILFYLFVLTYSMFSQSLSLFDVDASKFPTIKAKFLAFDSNGKQMTNFLTSDFLLKENDVTRNVTLVSCPAPKPLEAISSVLVMDVSGSMGCPLTRNIDLAKEAGKAWINGLPINKPWECAITAFDTRNYLLKDFTNDKKLLLEAIDRLTPNGGTNYDAAFIDPSAGGIRISEKGKYKKILVFLSDGQPNFEPQTSEIIRQARALGLIVYSVTLRMPCPQCLKDISTQTGGQWFENVTTVDEARAIYLRILHIAQNSGESCIIEWESDYSCKTLRNIDLTCLLNNTKSYSNYEAPEISLSKLEIDPKTISFGLVVPPNIKDTTFTIKTINRAITINSIQTNNPRFTIIDYGGSSPPFVLKKDEQRTITIRYTSPDSGFVFCWLKIESDACIYDGIYFSAGSKDKIPNNSLRLIYPNGGEEFLVGSVTELVWEGVLPSDTVILEYSTDGGNSWNLITDKATGLRHKWKVPNTPSRKCLGRVRKPGNNCSYSVQRIASLPYPLHLAEGIYVPSVNKVFVFGGQKNLSSDQLSNDILVYDVGQNKWAISRAKLPYGLYGQGLTTNNIDKVYISPQIGPTFNGGWGIHRRLIEYDFVNEVAKEIGPDLYDKNIWGCDLVYYNDYIYIFGGWTGSALNVISKYSVRDNTITRLNTRLAKGSHFDNVFQKGEDVYLVGGHDARAIQVFNLKTERIQLKGTFPTSDILDGYDLTIFEYCQDTSIMITPRSFSAFKFNLETGFVMGSTIPPELNFLKTSYSFLPQAVSLPNRQVLLFGGMIGNSITSDCYILSLNADNRDGQSDTSDSLWSILAPQISLDTLNIGTVCIGSYKDTVLLSYIENSLNIPLRIDSMVITGPNANDFYFVSGFAPPAFVLSPGENQTLEIGFHPSAEGYREANLDVYIGGYVITKKLTGYGVARNIEIVTKSIVFPDLEVRKSKDTIVTVVIVNNGPAPILVFSTRLVGADTSSFFIVSGGGAFTLNSGEGRTVIIRFSPRNEGRSQCYLEFVTVNDCQNPLVELFGNGVKCPPMISTSTFSPINLVCEETLIDSVKILNSGCDTLNIIRAEFIGADAASFNFVPPFQPFRLLPDSSVYFSFQFKPNRPGVHNASIVFYSNALPDSVVNIPINGQKDLVNFRISSDTIDLGVLCPNETKDTNFIISNIGTVAIGINVEADPNLHLFNQSFVLGANREEIMNVRFNGLATEGEFLEKITIRDTICNNVQSIFIKGEVLQPYVALEDLVVYTAVGTYSESGLKVQNVGKRTVEIISIAGIDQPFELIGVSLPIQLDVGEEINLKIRYTANDLDKDTIELLIVLNPCNLVKSCLIVGIPLSVTAELKTIEISGYPGDVIKVPIILSNEENLSLSNVNTFDVDFIFNPTLLYTKDYIIETIDGRTGKITVKDLPANKNIGDTLGEIEFIVGLGNAEESDLILSNASANGGIAEITLINGRFKLLGVCKEGGARLINPLNRVAILNIVPNPAEETFEIEVSLSEAGWTELALYNLLGEKVEEIISQIPNEQGVYKFSVKATSIGKGIFILQLRTSTVVESRLLIIK